MLKLPFIAAGAGVARRALDDWLSELGPALEFADDCQLALSELIGNAIRHARPLSTDVLEVALRREEGGVHIAVSDGGSSTGPRRVDAGVSDAAGRGLAIVEALAAQWSVESAGPCTTVHALLAYP